MSQPSDPGMSSSASLAARRLPCGLGDILRALRSLEIDDLAEALAVCALLLPQGRALPGAQKPAAPEVPSPEPVYSDPDASPSGGVTPSAAGADPPNAGDWAHVPTQVIAFDEQTPETTPQERSSAVLPLETAQPWEQTPRPLFRSTAERGIVRELASTVLESTQVDIEALVDALSRVERPDPLPVLTESTTRRGVQLLVDRGARMTGFTNDRRMLERTFDRVFGRERVEMLRFAELPTLAGADAVDTWKPYRQPAPLVPIVVVTVLGPATARRWSALVERWAKQARKVTFITPHGVERASASLVARAQFVHWEHSTTARSARRARTRLRAPGASRSREPLTRLSERNPEALRLACFASLAAFVEPALLRELRTQLLPDSSPSAELDIWTSDLVTGSSPDGFVFVSTVVEVMRRMASREPRLRDAFSIIQRLHERAPVLLRLEESLILDSLRSLTPAQLPRDPESLGLEAVLATMEGSAQRAKNLAHWFTRAAPRLPQAALRSEAGRTLRFIASAHVRGAPHLTTPLSDAALKRAAPLLPRKQTLVAVRCQAQGRARRISLVRLDKLSTAHTEWQALHVQSSDPMFIYVDDTRIEVSRSPVHVTIGERATLRDIGGTRWEVCPQDQGWAAVAVVRNPSTSHAARSLGYLIDDDLCVVSPAHHGATSLELEFAWGRVHASVLRGREERAFAFARLSEKVTPAPLSFNVDPDYDAEWEVLISAHARLRGRGIVSLDLVRGTILLPLAKPLESNSQHSPAPGAPVLIDGRVAAHVIALDPSGIRAVVASALRTEAAFDGVFAIPGLEQRLGRIQNEHETNEASFVPVLLVGRRTVLWLPARLDGPTLLGGAQRFSSGFVLDTADGPQAKLAMQWTPQRVSGVSPTRAQSPHIPIDFASHAARGQTLVGTLHNELGLYPTAAPVSVEGRLQIDLHSNPFQLSTGLPVFQAGRLVGLLGEFGQRAIELRPISTLVQELAETQLLPRDQARLQRLSSARPTHPVAIDTTEQLQFAFDQAIRRIEAQRSLRGPARRLRAEFVLDMVGRPRRQESNGIRSYQLRFTIVGDLAPIKQVTYELHPSYGQTHYPVSDYSNQFLLELVSYGDFEVVVTLDMPSRPPLQIASLLCDALDESYLDDNELSRLGADVIAIEAAIDDLRRR